MLAFFPHCFGPCYMRYIVALSERKQDYRVELSLSQDQPAGSPTSGG